MSRDEARPRAPDAPGTALRPVGVDWHALHVRDDAPAGVVPLQPLARNLHDPEGRYRQERELRAVVLRRLEERRLDLLPVRAIVHVDVIDHDQAADVSQPELERNLLRRRHVHLRRDGLVVAVVNERGAPGVDVDRGERLRLLNHDVRPGKRLV